MCTLHSSISRIASPLFNIYVDSKAAVPALDMALQNYLWGSTMNLFKAAALSAAMLVATAIVASAQQSASAPPANPPQVTTSSGFGYSSTRTPDPAPGTAPGFRQTPLLSQQRLAPRSRLTDPPSTNRQAPALRLTRAISIRKRVSARHRIKPGAEIG